MIEQRKTAMTRYFFGIGAIAAIWFVVSFVLSLLLAAAEDNPDMTATTPWPLKWACAIVFFPMRYLQKWDRVTDHTNTSFVIVGMLVNALFWGFLLIFLYRLATRNFVAK
ncbi:MAG: hypothetical protein ACLQVY_25490 [Limisphaerales bacterium]